MLNYFKSGSEQRKGKSLDFTLLFVLIIILCLGLVTLSSASSYYALTQYGNSTYYLSKQVIFAAIGIIFMLVISKIDYKRYLKLSYFGYIMGILLMLAVFIPGLGSSAKGATRWLNLGITTIQPSEVMKILLIMALSTYITKNQSKIQNLKGYLIPAALVSLIVVIMYFQDHLSGAIVMIAIACIVIFTGGIKLKLRLLIIGGMVFIAAVAGFIFSDDYRIERVFGFLNPEADISGGNWQPTQSVYAIGSGGVFGKGLGQSRQKYLWLPEAQNDFIFSIYAEEFGFVGVIVLLILLSYFIIRGITIGLKSKDLFGMLLTVGIIGLFAFQFIINIAVVTKSMPTTGMPFPFFSSGGTSLMINLMAMGIVLNVSRKVSKE